MSSKIQRVLTAILLLGLNLCATAQDEKVSRYALVIGNSDYVDQAPLTNPAPDCKLIAETLTKLNFYVDERYNLQTRREFLDAFQTLDEQASEASIVLVYYAGHGIAVNGSNYLLPTKAVLRSEFDVEDYAVSTKSVLRYFEKQENRANILILDACRDEPFKQTWNLSRGGSSDGLVKERGPIGSIVSYSTSYGSTAMDGAGTNSPFAESLAKNLTFPNISIERVFTKTREDVLLKTNRMQMPVEENQLLGTEIVLYEKRSLTNLTKENYLAAIDTAEASIRSQIYTTMIESHKRDTSFLKEIAQNWFKREFGVQSKFEELVYWMTSDLYNASSGHAGDVNELYRAEDFLPISEVFPISEKEWFPKEIHKKILIEQVAFSQVVSALQWSLEDFEGGSLEGLTSTVMNYSQDIWYDIYRYQSEILMSKDSLDFDDFFLSALWSVAHYSIWNPLDEISADIRREAALAGGDIDPRIAQGFFDFQTIAQRDFRQHQISEARMVRLALDIPLKMSWENAEESTLWRYALFFNLGEGAAAGLQFYLARHLIESSGAWCDEATFVELYDEYVDAWEMFLRYHRNHLENPASALFCSDAFFYLNQSRQYAALYGLPTEELDSLAWEYVEQFDLFAKKIDELEWWDLSDASMKMWNYPYSREVVKSEDEIWLQYFTIIAPKDENDTKSIIEYHKQMPIDERDLFSSILELGNGKSDAELQYALAPEDYEYGSDFGGLVDRLQLRDWLNFVSVNIVDNESEYPLLFEVNSRERVRRVNLFLENIVEPWYNDMKLGEYATIYELSTTTDLPLYWSIIDRVHNLVKNQEDIAFFSHLYFRILLDIQAKTKVTLNPIYFEKLLAWYDNYYDDLDATDQLYTKELLRYYSLVVAEMKAQSESYAAAEYLNLEDRDLEILKKSLLIQSDVLDRLGLQN